MRNKKLISIGAIAAVLGILAAMTILAGNSASTPSAASKDADLSVPSANMPLSANWKAQPAGGASVALAWPNLKVNPDSSNEAQNEPYVAVDPNNAKHIVVGANSWVAGNGHFEAYAYVSFDGGQSWAASQPYINRNASRQNAADPTVAFGSDGAVYFAFVALSPADGAVAVSRSTDGGLTWASQSWATGFSTGADKPAIAAANGNLYLYYQNGSLYGTVSSDRGTTWNAATFIEAGGRNANPVVSAKGTVNVFYNTANSIKLARLVNGAYNVSTVANTTALQPRAAGYRAGIYAAAGIDSAGTLSVAWADGRNAGHGNDILYTRSGNEGYSWSAPVTVNSDNSSADQLMPALVVGKDGGVTVSWLDTRNDAKNVNYDVYMSHATDGVSFGANQRVTNVSSNPNNDPRTQGSMIGDYFGLATGNSIVYAVWTDTRNNNEDIYMAPISNVAK